ncbi:protein of unknown function [Catalinimonas alkaloidigena]|uniref:DUF4168 domain-containing protein n=1 Tax=Catalinimonas alkaloidigena TaxID=1075417 RepID=A0A1G9J564_9BACT|nr:DUF4168 domain-containing protein [Catalinimonas alkaloidigena]SDL32609.1 protein of unknown function [Catalinimonas alkaloidigena]
MKYNLLRISGFLMMLLSLSVFAVTNVFAQDGESFTDEEVELYAQSVYEIDQLKKGINDTLLVIIQEEGMEPKRYNEVNRASKKDDFETAVPEEERMQFQKIEDRMTDIKASLNSNATEAIKATGLELGRYNDIKKAARKDPELKAKINTKVEELAQATPTEEEEGAMEDVADTPK